MSSRVRRRPHCPARSAEPSSNKTVRPQLRCCWPPPQSCSRSTSPRGSSSRSMTEGRVHRPRPWSSTGAGMPRGPAVPGPSSACAATRPPRCSPSKAPPRSWPRSCAKTDAPSSSTRGSAEPSGSCRPANGWTTGRVSPHRRSRQPPRRSRKDPPSSRPTRSRRRLRTSWRRDPGGPANCTCWTTTPTPAGVSCRSGTSATPGRPRPRCPSRPTARACRSPWRLARGRCRSPTRSTTARVTSPRPRSPSPSANPPTMRPSTSRSLHRAGLPRRQPRAVGPSGHRRLA